MKEIFPTVMTIVIRALVNIKLRSQCLYPALCIYRGLLEVIKYIQSDLPLREKVHKLVNNRNIRVS